MNCLNSALTWKAGGAGSRFNGRRGQRGPVVGCLCLSHCILEIDVELLPILTHTQK